MKIILVKILFFFYLFQLQSILKAIVETQEHSAKVNCDVATQPKHEQPASNTLTVSANHNPNDTDKKIQVFMTNNEYIVLYVYVVNYI